MTPEAILDRLEGAGLRLTSDRGDLVVTPREAITPELRALMRENKPALLTLLEGPRGDGYSTADLSELDRLIRELAHAEGWDPEELEGVLDETRSMAPANVRNVLSEIRHRVKLIPKTWPERGPRLRLRVLTVIN